MNPKSLLNFEKFVTPSIIKIVYWIACVGIAITSLSKIIRGLKYDSASELIAGILMLILAPLYLRVLCEVILVFFQISTDLSAVRYYSSENFSKTNKEEPTSES